MWLLFIACDTRLFCRYCLELAAFFKLPRHDRICPLLAACLEPDLLFVSPLLPHGSLKQLLDNTRTKSLSAADQKAIGAFVVLRFD